MPQLVAVGIKLELNMEEFTINSTAARGTEQELVTVKKLLEKDGITVDGVRTTNEAVDQIISVMKSSGGSYIGTVIV